MKNHGRYALKNVSLKSGYSAGYVRGLYSNIPRNPTIGAVDGMPALGFPNTLETTDCATGLAVRNHLKNSREP